MSTSLFKLQKAFAAQLLSQNINQAFLETINSLSCDEARVRLQIYRNNVLSSLVQALGDTYPVIKRLIGEDCFKVVATHFVRAHPPDQASLYFYGKNFPEFINTHHSCRHLVYLSDVARLEWRYQCAFHADDAGIISLNDLQAVDAESLGDICLNIHPSVQLLTSQWPVDEIWRENLQEQPAALDLSNHTEASLFIFRDGLKVKVMNVEKHTFDFLQNMMASHTIEQAWLMTDQPVDQLGAQLGFLLSLPVFSGYQLNSIR